MFVVLQCDIEQRQVYSRIQWDEFGVRCDDQVLDRDMICCSRKAFIRPAYDLKLGCYYLILTWVCSRRKMRASFCMVWVMDRIKELQICLKIQFLISDDGRRHVLAWLALHFELAALWKVHQLRAMLAHVLAKISVLGDQCSVIGELQWDLSCFFVSPRLGIIK